MDASGLYYYGTRFYDPSIGGFINKDPAMGGLNWYGYVRIATIGMIGDIEPPTNFPWPGKLSYQARAQAAEDQAGKIRQYIAEIPDKPVTVIGHSHEWVAELH